MLITLLAMLAFAPQAAAAEPVTLSAHRGTPFAGQITLDDPAYIPLAVRNPALPPGPGAAIGVVSNGSRLAVVKVGGAPVNVDGVLMLPVTLTSDGPTGTYTGSVDLATGAADPSTVKLTVDATDGPLWALAAVALGFLAGILYTLWTGRWVPRGVLGERARKLKPAYEEAKRSFDAVVPSTFAFHDYAPDLTAVAGYQSDLEAAIARWARHTIVADRDAAEYKAIIKLLQTAEDDATLFGERLAPSLQRLATASTTIKGDQPQVLKLMVGRLEGAPLKVGGATQVAAEADAYTAFAPQWVDYATEVKRLALWHDLIAAATPADAKALDGAEADVAWARQRLLEAESASDLTAVEFDKRLGKAYDRLTPLGVATGVPRPGKDAVAGRSLERQVAYTDLVGIPRAVSGVAAVVERAGLLASQALIPLVGAIVAILVGLPTIFSDDTFGSWQDYLAAVTLGVAAAVGAKGVLAVAQALTKRETLS